MKKRTMIVIAVAGFIGFGAVANAVEAEKAPVASEAADKPAATASKSPEPKKSEAPKVEAPKVEAPKVEAPKVEAPKVEAPKYTRSQEQAIRAAESYLETMPFSKNGLIDQLSSEYGSGFSVADAKFAVNHIEVNWKAEAVEAAESYLETMPFSRSGLIDQLSSEYGSQFTRAEAVYAVNKVGL